MKVIVAGFSKTGTKSMVAALTELDYKVCDALDHYWYHGDDWNKIFTTGGSIEDFKKMYQDVDAVTDLPACFYWEEISRAFPNCKIILTTRDEDKWFKSWKEQMAEYRDNKILRISQIITPAGYILFRFLQRLMGSIGLIYMYNHPLNITAVNELQCRKIFRQHQAYCLQNAPKNRLLVYNVSQGWEPLCNFLGVNIPNKPFPHENKGAKFWEETMMIHPSTIRMQRELMISLSLLFGFSVFGAYKFFKRGGVNCIVNVPNRLKSLFDACVSKWRNI